MSDAATVSRAISGARSSRILSHTEISRSLDCEAAWDFSYGGYLAGAALRPKVVAPTLGAGRAWGAAVAAWHAAHREQDPLPSLGKLEAITALADSLDGDATRMTDHGVYDPQARFEMEARLRGCLDHYVETATALPITKLEQEIVAPIPSRTGLRASSRYRFLGLIDGWYVDEVGRNWIVEFKFRGRLTPVWLIERSRQIRWYAWAFAARKLGPDEDVAGVIVDERLNEAPKPPRVLKSGKPSHAKDQLCTAEDYHALCDELGESMNPETHAHLLSRRWQQRVPILFRTGELQEAGLELVSAAQKIAELDSGRRYPLRNTKQTTCNGCAFKEVCPTPDDTYLVDALFERTVPKRLKEAA